MSIRLGNIQFSEVESQLGYRLNDDDRVLWETYHNQNADLSGMDSSFHVFDMPRSIHFRGDAAMNAILKMFAPDKMVSAVGSIPVYRDN